MTFANHQGGCLCGAVRYRATGQPALVQACHCKTCQRRTGSAFALIAAFRTEQVEMLGADPAGFEHRSDESGRWVRNHFCGRCGTTVLITLERNPGVSVLAVGTFDDPHWLKPQRHIWTRSRHDWVALPADAQVREQG
ncbi:MAG: GFA family protein [Rhodocyclaceae bacterium]|nr:GFA family protein [Rhodocyclaceae bacterium]